MTRKMVKNRTDDFGKSFSFSYAFIAIFLFLFVGPLVLFKPAFDYTIIKNVVGFLFCLFAAIGFLSKKKELSFSTPVLIVFLSFFLWVLISCFAAPFKHGAASSLEHFLLYFLVFLIAVNMEIKKEWIYLWLFSGLICEITASLQFFGIRKYAISTFGNPNFFAGHFLMPLLLGLSLLRQKKFAAGEKVFLILLVISGIIAIVTTRSRAAIFALLFGISTLIFLTETKITSFKKWSGFIIIFSGLACLSPKIYSWILTNIRYYIWRGTWRLIKIKPLSGWGLGNFSFFYPYVRIREYFLQAESTPITNHPHSEYLELWVELGLIGLILFLILLFLVIFLAIKQKSHPHPEINSGQALNHPPSRGRVETLGEKNTPSRERVLEREKGNFKAKKDNKNDFCKILIPGLISAVTAVLVDNIFSTNLRNPSTAMYFWFSAGILCSFHSGKKFYSLKLSRPLWITVISVSFAMALFVSYYRIVPDIFLKKGLWAKDFKRYKEAIANYSVVCERNPYNYITWYKLAYVHGQTGNYEKAKEVYLYINNHLFPHFAKTDANLGTVYLKDEKFKQSLGYYRWAEWLNPYNEDVLCSIVSIYLIYYKDKEKAKWYLKRILTINPENSYANRVLKMLEKEKERLPRTIRSQ